MNPWKKKAGGLAVAGAVALGLATGCDGGSTGSSIADIFLPIQEVDLAVGDVDGNQVGIFLDVLNNTDTNPDTTLDPASPPLASILLDNAGSGIADPTALLFDGEDLYVGDSGNDTVRIFRGYASLADAAAPDVVLDNGTAGISDPSDMAIGDDTLAVANDGNDTVGIFLNTSAIAANQAADAVLNNGGSLIDDPQAVFITSDGRLIVANGANTAGNPLVAIFNDVSTLASADAPDVALNEDTSFLDAGNTANEILVDEDDNLFVATWGPNGASQVFVFFESSSLATDDLPDAVLYGQDSLIDFPWGLAAMGDLDTLLVGNANFNTGVCTAAPGLVGFYPVSGLVDGQGASVHPPQETMKLGYVNRRGLATAGNALFANGTINNCGGVDPYAVYIFRNVAALGLQDDTVPNIIITGDDGAGISEFIDIDTMAVNDLDAGT